MRTLIETETHSRLNPLDLVEQIVGEHEWPFDRQGQDELTVGVSGRYCEHQMWFSWREELGALSFTCAFDMKVPTTFQGWMALIGKTLAPGWSTEPRSIATMGASDMAACARMRFTIETDGSARMNFPCVGSGGAITLQARTDSAAHRGHQQRCR